MARTFREAIARNNEASEMLELALRECLSCINEKPEAVVEGRFRILKGGREVVGKGKRV